MRPLLPLVLALLAAPGLGQGRPLPAAGLSSAVRERFQKPPHEIRALIQDYMVQRPYATLANELLLSGRDLDRAREILEENASTTFHKHRVEVREGLPGLAATVGKSIEAELKLRRALAEGVIEGDVDDYVTSFSYLQVTVVDRIVRILPPDKIDPFLEAIGPQKQKQLAQLGHQRARAFKKAGPKMLRQLAALRGGKGKGKGKGKGGPFGGGPPGDGQEGFQGFGEVNAPGTGLFGGRGRGGRGGGRQGARGPF